MESMPPGCTRQQVVKFGELIASEVETSTVKPFVAKFDLAYFLFYFVFFSDVRVILRFVGNALLAEHGSTVHGIDSTLLWQLSSTAQTVGFSVQR